MRTVVKALKISVALNAEIRIKAMRLGISAHSLIIDALEREFLPSVPKEVAPVAMPEQEAKNGKPRTNEPQQAIPKTETQAQKPIKSRPTKATIQEDDIQERFGMFTYKGAYYGTLQEAEAAKG